MRAGAAGLLAALTLLSGCEVSHRLGDRLDKAVDDAGAADEDAAVPDRLMKPVLEQGGTEAELDTLRKAMVGDWWGATSYDEMISEPFEVHFDRDGTYSTRCLSATEALCEPFGSGSDGAQGLLWEVFTLDSDGAGQGSIQGVLDLPPLSSRTVEMALGNVRYRENDESLSFLLAGVVHSANLEPKWVLVALNRGNFDDEPATSSAQP